MGRGAGDVQEELKLFPFHVSLTTRATSVLKLQLGDKVMTPPEVSAHILRKLKEDAEEVLGAQTSRRP